MRKISKKLISSVILSLIMYAPVNNVYAATLEDGAIFGKNDIELLGDDSYDSYRTESNGVFTYDFNGDSQLNITTKDTGVNAGVYIMTDNRNSVNTIKINNELDVILTKEHSKATLSGIIISPGLSDKTIDRSFGGDIIINSYDDETTGAGTGIIGADISALDNNTILLGTSNIILNATNVKYGMNLTGLRVTNGTNNKIDMKDGNIKITGNIKSDSSNYAEAYGMDASGSGNIISTEDVSVDIDITGDQNSIMTIASGNLARNGGSIDSEAGDIDVYAINENGQSVYVYGINADSNGKVGKDSGKITVTAEGNGILSATGMLANNGIVDVKLADILVQTIGKNKANTSIGLWGASSGVIYYGGGSITATADNVDAYVAAIHAQGDAVINVNQGTENKVVINGDVNNRGNGLINLTLNTESSAINGAIDDRSTKGINLTLADGAEWNNTGASNVKSVIMNQGIINQSIDEGITINNYSGTGDINFKAKNNTVDGVLDLTNIGNVTIENAGVGSVTNLSANADNTLNTIDSAKAYENLNAIANKIYYTNHLDGNITGSVKIAEGLITPEASGDLLFYEVDSNGHTAGQGYVANVKQNSSTTTIDNIKNIAATAIVAWRQEDSTLSQRLGELRESDGGQGIWVRMSRGEFEYDGEYKNQYNFFQMGYDWAAGSWHYGAAVSHNDGQTTYTHGDGENRSTSLSLYGTWLGDKGHYADIVLKQGRLSNDFDIYTEAGHTSGDYDAWGTSLSGEYGMKVDLDGGWYVTPQAQLTLMRIGGEDYTTNNGIKVNQDSLESAVGRVGFEVGKRISDSGSIYAKASLLHDFAGSADTYLSLNGLTNSYHQDIGDTWCEAGIGFNYKTSENSYVYADVVKTFGGDVVTPWQWNAGMRWTF